MSLAWRPHLDESLLDPTFLADIKDVLGESEYAWRVAEAFRTYDYQNGLYLKHLAGGPLAAPPGHSAHEFGLAVDVCRFKAGVESWAYAGEPAWPWLWDTCRAHPRLHSGHDFGDDDHIQAVAWKLKKQELRDQGKW